MLFLHHYLPSFIYSCMLLAGIFEFIGRILVQSMSPEEQKNNKLPIKSWFKNQGGSVYWAVLIVSGLVFLWSFLHFMPLTYGTGFVSKEDLNRRKWLDSFDLQHA
jgi:dolichyl-phosphate-mannose-protein mannosyltransferase